MVRFNAAKNFTDKLDDDLKAGAKDGAIKKAKQNEDELMPIVHKMDESDNASLELELEDIIRELEKLMDLE